MASKGAQIQSSQWVGWVPSGNNCGRGDLGSSTFSIRNLRVSGTVVQGPQPSKCSSPPGPKPSPSAAQCPGQHHCGCSWARSVNCGVDDGSECWCRCCCEHTSSHSCKWHSYETNTSASLLV